MVNPQQAGQGALLLNILSKYCEGTYPYNLVSFLLLGFSIWKLIFSFLFQSINWFSHIVTFPNLVTAISIFFLKTAFSSMVDGKNEEMSTSELSGGARIHYIFQSIFVRSLEVYNAVFTCDISSLLDFTYSYVMLNVEMENGYNN